MRVKALVIILFIFCYSCNGIKKPRAQTDLVLSNHSLLQRYDTISVNPKLDSMILEFCEANPCDSCINEVFIDKVLPSKTIITLRSRPFSSEYLRNNNPLFFLKIEESIFYVYMGVEEIFIGRKPILNSQSSKRGDSLKYNSWNIFIDSGRYEIEKLDVGIPFYPATPAQISVNRN